MNLYIIDKNTKEKYLVVKYICKVKEKGSDTDISLSKITIYIPKSRSQHDIELKDFDLVIED